MTIQPFEYIAPGTLKEAFGYLQQPASQVLVGDQAFVGLLKKGQGTPGGIVVSFKNLPDFNEIVTDGNALTLGTTATYAEVKTHPNLESFAALKEALATVTDPQRLNHSTVGGALYHGTLFHAPVVGALMALNAELRIVSQMAERVVSVDEFYQKGGPSSLISGELVRAVRLDPTPNLSSGYDEIKLLTGSRPLCGLAVAISMQDDKVASARVVLTQAVAVPGRLAGVEQGLTNKALDSFPPGYLEKLVNEETIQLADDLPIQENYLRHLMHVLLKRTLTKIQTPTPR